MNCADKSALTWNTALGNTTLAVDHQHRNGTDEGYTGLQSDLAFGRGVVMVPSPVPTVDDRRRIADAL
jgi:hypothetical protein